MFINYNHLFTYEKTDNQITYVMLFLPFYTIMVYNKVIAPNKVRFSYFNLSYENQIIPENCCILNDILHC